MNGKKIAALLAVLCCLMVFSACQTAQPPAEPTETIAEATSELTTAESTTEKQVKAVPPIDIEDVPFVLAEMDCYLEFDKDGLAMPEIRALFEKEKVEFEENVGKSSPFKSPFSLETAEYDMNDDGEMDYVVKWYHYDINPGSWGAVGYFDIVYRSGGKLKRMHTNNEMNISCFSPAVLRTKTNGFHDVANIGITFSKSSWKYDGTHYREDERAIEKVDIHKIFSWQDDNNSILEGNRINLKYNFLLSNDDPPPFFIAGLFKTAQKNGIVTQERLWCCDENGDPKLLVNHAWNGAFFRDEYGGGELPGKGYDVWFDEVEIVLYEP